MTTSWDDLAKGWRQLYSQQTDLAKEWLEGQSKLAGSLMQAGAGEGATADAMAMGELWKSWLTLGGSFGRALPGFADGGSVAQETLGRFLDPVSLALVGGSQVGETIRRLTEGPRFADLGVAERRVARLMELWLEVQRRARGYEAVVASAWVEANKRFAAELQERYHKGEAPKDPREALKLWLEVANRSLLETHRSEPFLKAQAELLRHGMDFLLAEREMVEALVEPAGLPTRSEMDEVHRSLTELKRRVRALEKAQGPAAPAPVAAAPAKPRPVARRRPAARKPPRRGGEGTTS